MSAVTIDGDLIHYEKLGRGRPVILVHGWIGSWRYWIPLMQQLHLKYSVYTLDLPGFGDSAKNLERYSLSQQVSVLEQFLEQLGIPKAALIGHGLGSIVVAEFANRQPDKVARVLLCNAPLYDTGDLASRRPTTQHSVNGNNPLKSAFTGQKILDLLDRCFKRSEPEYDKIKIDVDKADDRVLLSSVDEFNPARMLDAIRLIGAPTAIVHGNDDPILPSPSDDIWQYLTDDRDNNVVAIPLPDVRHFPMLEHKTFSQLTGDFLEAADVSRLQVRGRWMRRSR